MAPVALTSSPARSDSVEGPCLCAQEALPSGDTRDQIASLLMEQLGGLQYPDDLVTFFSDMSQLMHSHAAALDVDAMKGGADISSAFGFYIRHCCVSFHMLSFEVRSPCLVPGDHFAAYILRSVCQMCICIISAFILLCLHLHC